MLVISKEEELIQTLNNLKNDDQTTGFVPTMGALHQGHLSLVETAIKNNNHVVVSIFINPIQFNNEDDLKNYPKTLDTDLKKLESISNKIIVFTPSKNEIFKNKNTNQIYQFKGIDKKMEGAFRPNHFNGVAIIVEILLNIVQPTNAYFGEKDFQQLQIVKELVLQKNIKTKIIGCPILRENNGLAMSSRNERLSTARRKEAQIIYQTLKEAQATFKNTEIITIQNKIKSTFSQNNNFNLEYFEIANERTLQPEKTKKQKTQYRAFIAVETENIRLIDNISLI